MNYDVNNWYWKKQDGGIYSSAQGAVTADNAGYKAFLADGNYPAPYPKDAEGNESVTELFAVLSSALESYLNGKVKAERGYDSVDALPKYAIQKANAAYKAEAEAAASWVAQCWDKWFALEGEAEAGGEMLGVAAMLDELPALAWPKE
jgi:hypothetical protein